MRSCPNFTLKTCFSGPAWIYCFLLFLITGCNSSELAELTSIRSTPISITATNLGSYSNVVFYAKRSDGAEGFAKFFTSEPSIEREVRNGMWDFYGISYTGFEVTKCAQASMQVEKIKKFVVLDFSNGNCADKVFLGTDSRLNPSAPTAVTFNTTRLEFCESVQGISSSSDECTDDLANTTSRKQARGHAGAFRYTLVSFEKTRGNYEFSSDGITSACVLGSPAAGSLSGLSATRMGFNVPAGDGSTTPFFVRLEVFPGNNCTTGTPAIVDLPNGLISDSVKTKYVMIPGSPYEHKLYVKVSGDEICTGDNLNTEFAGGSGSVETPRLICNANQLYNIFPALAASYTAYSVAKYKLLKDIDLTNVTVGVGGNYHPAWEACVTAGSNFMPIGVSAACINPGSPLNGPQFDGGGKTITGLKMNRAVSKVGLYFEITNASIRRLTLKDAAIVGPGNTGGLVGQSYNSTIRGITITSSTITGSAANTGSLVGQAQGGVFKDIIVNNTTVLGTSHAGGVIGRGIYSGSTTVSIENAHVNATVKASAEGSVVGGFAGLFGSNGFRSTISNSSFKGLVEGFKVVGGLTGSTASARFENTYVNATVRTKATTNNQAGGFSGTFFGQVVDYSSGIHKSYFLGTIDESCVANDYLCVIGTLIGSPGGYANTDFASAVYSDSSYMFYGSTHFGYAQDDSTFLSVTPGWQGAGGVSIMPLFDPLIWEFRDNLIPRLRSEP